MCRRADLHNRHCALLRRRENYNELKSLGAGNPVRVAGVVAGYGKMASISAFPADFSEYGTMGPAAGLAHEERGAALFNAACHLPKLDE